MRHIYKLLSDKGTIKSYLMPRQYFCVSQKYFQSIQDDDSTKHTFLYL